MAQLWRFLLVCWWVAQAAGQQFHVQNWHVEDGLPDGEITAIQQTPDGYLWVGTPKGLARFDGERFKLFRADSSPALTDSRVTWLLTSRDGTLWVSTQDGNIVRMRHGRFESARAVLGPDGAKPGTRSPGSWLWERRMHIIESSERAEDESMLDNRLIEDNEGSIWGYFFGATVIRLRGGQWSIVAATNGLPAEGIRQLSVDHEGEVWVEAKGKLHCYRGGGGNLPQEAVALTGRWPVLAPANQGGLWVAEPRGSWFLNGGQVRRFYQGAWHSGPKPIPAIPLTPGSTVTCLMEDHAGRLWYGTASGGVFFSDAEGDWHRLNADNPFSQGYISCFFEDNHGSIWVGTVGDGLYRVTPQPLAMLSLPASFGNAEINTICVAHDGSLWIGTGGFGLFRYKDRKFSTFGAAQGLGNLHVCAVFEDSHTNVWAGTSEGLFRLEPGGFARVEGPPEMSKWVKSIYEDARGRLWIGTIGALIARQNDRFAVYYLRPDQGYCDIRSMAEDKAGNLWIGTIGQGLYCLPDGQPEKLHREKGFPATDARSLFCSKDGTLWIGTWGQGLVRSRNGAFTAFTTEDGLPSDRIQSTIGDDQDRLWLSTDNGVIGIAPQVIQNYRRGQSPPLWCLHLSLAEGLANRGCSGSGQPVSARLPDGRLLFPDYEGVAVLNPVAVGVKPKIPEVVTEAVLADGKPLTEGQEGELLTPSSARRFEFDFTAPELSMPQNLRFRYRLDGLDHGWVEAGAQNVAYYSQLKPGKYQFRAMVGGSDGEWHGPDKGVSLRIVPRLWEQRSVQLVIGGLLISALAMGIARAQRRKFRLKLERLEMQHALENERHRIARDLHDELGARLTATALQGELALQDGKLPDNAKTEMGLITRRVRQLIGAVDEVVWATDPENDSVPSVATFLCDYVEHFLEPTGISCRLEVTTDLPALPLGAQTRRNLLFAAKEALSNGVRHASAKTILLRMYLQHGYLFIEIADDGQGFKVAQGRAGGKGLSNIRTRMEMLHGRAEIQSEPGKGTTVRLCLPLPKPAAANDKRAFI